MQGQGGDRWGALCRSRGAGTRGGLWGGQGSALSEGQGPGPADRVAAGRRGHRGDGLERGLDALRLGSVRWAAGCRVRLSWVPAMEMLWKSRGAGREQRSVELGGRGPGLPGAAGSPEESEALGRSLAVLRLRGEGPQPFIAPSPKRVHVCRETPWPRLPAPATRQLGLEGGPALGLPGPWSRAQAGSSGGTAAVTAAAPAGTGAAVAAAVRSVQSPGRGGAVRGRTGWLQGAGGRPPIPVLPAGPAEALLSRLWPAGSSVPCLWGAAATPADCRSPSKRSC